MVVVRYLVPVRLLIQDRENNIPFEGALRCFMFSKGFVLSKITLVLVMMTMASCQQEAFFEKEELVEAINLPDATVDTEIPDINLEDEGEDQGEEVVVTPEPTTPQEPVVVVPEPTNPTEPPVVVTPEPTNPTEPPVVVTPEPTEPEEPIVVTPEPTEPEEPVIEDPVDTTEIFAENFKQNSEGKRVVDILWVVDNSGSMGGEQKDLAYNFETFINNFITQDVDFQMAITTTDARNGHEGKMIAGPDKLNSEEAKKNEHVFINHFKQKIKVGTRGSAQEKGLQTSAALLENQKYDKWNFVRDDAYLAIVYVSDEEDQSKESVQEYVNKFKSLKKNEGLVKVYSIVLKEEDVSHSWYKRNQGKRYEEAAKLTNGKTESIRNDFHTILEDMGDTIVKLSSSFPLAKKSVDGLHEVFVNGVKSEAWMYNEETNSITFEQDSAPEAGANIEVKYTVEK